MVFNLLGAIAAPVISGLFGNEQADAAADASRLGFDYLRGSPLGTSYLPTGGRANDMIAALLGAGGDEEAANAAYQNFLNSTGFQSALDAGSRAITGNRAARGILQSGRTGPALQEFGQNLERQNFFNYLGGLEGLAGRGLSAGATIGGAGSSAAPGVAQAQNQRYDALAEAAGTIGARLPGVAKKIPVFNVLGGG